MATRTQTLTVVIATYTRALSLKHCLHSLTHQSDRVFDVLIIDGGSADGTERVVLSFKTKLHVTYIVDTTSHLSHIRDMGWMQAKGDIVASIDDDVVVDSGWVAHIKKGFRDFRGVGGITGPTVIPEKLLKKRDVFFFHTTKHWFWKRIAWLYFFLFMNGERFEVGKIYPSGAWSPGSNFRSSRLIPKPIRVDYLEACNFAVRKDIVRQIGGYDLGYEKTSEWCEVDLAFRIRKAGYTLLFDPSVSVEHHVSIGGVFDRRTFPLHRLTNFLRFYVKTYYPKSFIGWIQFGLYVLFISGYYVARMLKKARG